MIKVWIQIRSYNNIHFYILIIILISFGTYIFMFVYVIHTLFMYKVNNYKSIKK